MLISCQPSVRVPTVCGVVPPACVPSPRTAGALFLIVGLIRASCNCADESVASYLASTAPQVQKKCAQPACGDPATHHLKTFLHGRTRVTLSVTVVPAAQALPDADHGQIWVWARPLVGDPTPDPAVRRVRLSQDAGCLSFGEVPPRDPCFVSFICTRTLSRSTHVQNAAWCPLCTKRIGFHLEFHELHATHRPATAVGVGGRWGALKYDCTRPNPAIEKPTAGHPCPG